MLVQLSVIGVLLAGDVRTVSETSSLHEASELLN